MNNNAFRLCGRESTLPDGMASHHPMAWLHITRWHGFTRLIVRFVAHKVVCSNELEELHYFSEIFICILNLN